MRVLVWYLGNTMWQDEEVIMCVHSYRKAKEEVVRLQQQYPNCYFDYEVVRPGFFRKLFKTLRKTFKELRSKYAVLS